MRIRSHAWAPKASAQSAAKAVRGALASATSPKTTAATRAAAGNATRGIAIIGLPERPPLERPNCTTPLGRAGFVLGCNPSPLSVRLLVPVTERFVQRLRGRLAARLPVPAPPLLASVPADVLVPLFDHAGGLTVLLTVRAGGLADHAGQISFPGGRMEAADVDLIAAALREADEEVGIAAEFVEVLGCLPGHETGTGFWVAPVVGLVWPSAAVRVAPAEVAEVFEVPLSYILDRANHQRETATPGGRSRTYYVLPYAGRRIWGATAAMLVSLADVIGEWTG